MNQLTNLDNSLYAFSEIFPPKEPETKFDKFLELIKAFSSGTFVGVVGQALETTVKTCAAFATEKQRVKGVKYVADAYAVRCNAEIEMKKLALESEKNKSITLYIEQSFQKQIYEIQKSHKYKMQELRTRKEVTLYEIDKYAQERLEGINKEYAVIIRKNEGLCDVYRKYLMAMKEMNIPNLELMRILSREYMRIVERAIFDKSVKMSDIQEILNLALKIVEFCGTQIRDILPFEEYIKHKREMEEPLVWDGKL